jgi:hypothetical protein
MPGFGTDPTFALNNARASAQNADGSFRPGAAYDYYRKLQMQQMLQQQQAANADALANSPEARAEANRQKLYGLAEGRLGELKGDQTDALVLAQLTARANGSQNPYDDQTINALLTGQNEQSAQAATNQQNQLDRLGLRATDPAYQSRLAEIQAQRQQANQAANLNIRQQANVANYGARGQALAGLGSFNMAHNAAITDQGRYLGGLYQQEQFRQETPPVQYVLPNYQQYAQYQTQAPQVPRYQPAQQTQQAPQQQARPASSQTGPVYGPPSPYNPIINGQQAINRTPTTSTSRPSGGGYIQLAGQPETRITTPPTYQPPQIPYNRYGATQTYGLDF